MHKGSIGFFIQQHLEHLSVSITPGPNFVIKDLTLSVNPIQLLTKYQMIHCVFLTNTTNLYVHA